MIEHQPQDLFIWSDESLLVINKPAGISSLPHGYDSHRPHLRAILEPNFGKLWVVHRLDIDTSGVMIFARSPEAHKELNILFADRQVDKRYHALVVGEPQWGKREVRLPLVPDGDRKHRTIIDPRRGKHAHTDLLLLERFEGYALVEARPHTGRRHQIRAHLAASGFPIVADALYGSGSEIFLSHLKKYYHSGKTPETPLLARLGLHARSLAIKHPLTKQPLFFEAPYPKDFKITIKQCRKYSSRGKL